MSPGSGLTVRQHQRDAIEIGVEFVVANEHCEQVRFSPMSSAVQPHIIRGVATDISSGGLGIDSKIFVPRMTEGTVRIYNCTSVEALGDASVINEVIFEHKVKVRRVILLSHDPTYSLGMAFIDPPSDIDQRVDRLMEQVIELMDIDRAKRGGDDV